MLCQRTIAKGPLVHEAVDVVLKCCAGQLIEFGHIYIYIYIYGLKHAGTSFISVGAVVGCCGEGCSARAIALAIAVEEQHPLGTFADQNAFDYSCQ